MRKVKTKTVSDELAEMCEKVTKQTRNGERVEINFLKDLRKRLEHEIYGNFVVRTMTVQELVNDMRAHGMSTTPEKVKAFIIQGLYPFAVGFRGNVQQCEIYAKKYEEWLRDVGEETK